jgi:hypothetical protein
VAVTKQRIVTKGYGVNQKTLRRVDKPQFAIVVPSCNRIIMPYKLLVSIRKFMSQYFDFKCVFVIYNGDKADSLVGVLDEMRSAFGWSEQLYYTTTDRMCVGEARNIGINYAVDHFQKTDYIMSCDDDCEIATRNCVWHLLDVFKKYNNVGVVGSIGGAAARWHTAGAKPYVSQTVGGTLMVFKPSLVQHIGNFDSKLEVHEDIDFTLRATIAGYVNYKVPEAKILHLGYFDGGIERDVSMLARSAAVLCEKYGSCVSVKVGKNNKFMLRTKDIEALRGKTWK